MRYPLTGPRYPSWVECCGTGCDGYASPIDEKVVRADVERYRRRGPDPTTAILLRMIEAEGVAGGTLLDIGGGIGVIDHELLRAGASRAVLVEASPEYLEAARGAAREAGMEDRMAVAAGDFVRHAAGFAEADIVTLDRVVCCYPDADALVSASAAKARRLYGLVLPRDRWYVRLAIRLDNLRYRFRRHGYRAHAHSHAGIDALTRAQGLRVRSEAFTALWRVVLYRREGGGAVSSARDAGDERAEATAGERILARWLCDDSDRSSSAGRADSWRARSKLHVEGVPWPSVP